MAFAEHDGIRLRYVIEGEGPPLLMHHLGMGRLDDWYDLGYVANLADSFRLVLFDARGHGESDKPNEPGDFAAETMVGDVVAVLDAAGVDRAHYFGYSMGGKVGWAAAEFAPERFRSWIIGGADPYASDESAQGMIDLLEAGGMTAVIDALGSMWDVPESFVSTLQRNDPDVLRAYFRSTWPDLGAVTAKIEAPSLFFVGERDAVRDAVERAARETEDALFLDVPDADHLSAITDVEFVSTLVTGFAAEI